MPDQQELWQKIECNPVQFLLGGQALSAFRSGIWEQHPCLCAATDNSRSFLTSLASRSVLQAALATHIDEVGSLEFGVDLVAAKYQNGHRESCTAEEGTSKAIWQLFKEGCTLQIIQPQRWLDSLWRLTAALEAQLGCLVGINAYLTPAGTQGLAPHHDDVELWVCQTQGSKRWRLYKPWQGLALPALPSPDFDPADIGDPIMDVTLQEGDVLYMPRGTVHQAVAQSSDSIHLTISTYQSMEWQRA
ncbi:hypothetical protein WJX73_001613 [Symbiochloris irregularis]|uniref:Bifunctional lysine-specific demethylase and histidyl-hydroxylase n=1 Tax=Symbiochloris irregularis TaxID=706552 RepID=A0AAW1P122_9CHLO